MVRISKGNFKGLIQKQKGEERQMVPTTTVRMPLTLRSVVPSILKEPEEQAIWKRTSPESDV